MNFLSPAYAKFTYKGYEYEGEFHEERLMRNFDDYVNADKLPPYGYIRPFDRDLRQSIINRNIRARELSYMESISNGDILECDALVTSEQLCSIDNSLLVSEVELIEKKDLKASKEDIELCRKDIVDRKTLQLDSWISNTKSLIEAKKGELYALQQPRHTTTRESLTSLALALMYLYGTYTGFKESLSLGALWCIAGYFISDFIETSKPIKKKRKEETKSFIIERAEKELIELLKEKENMMTLLERGEPIISSDAEPLKYELISWWMTLRKMIKV